MPIVDESDSLICIWLQKGKQVIDVIMLDMEKQKITHRIAYRSRMVLSKVAPNFVQ